MKIGRLSKKKKRAAATIRKAYEPDVSKVVIGSAIGAAMGALVGAAFVRKPNLLNDMIQQFGGLPAMLSTLQGMTSAGPDPEPRHPARGRAPHPPEGCGTPGCPTNNPHALEEEEARVAQENPSWTHTQVLKEVSKRLNDQMDQAHAVADEKRTSRAKKKKNSSEETPN